MAPLLTALDNAHATLTQLAPLSLSEREQLRRLYRISLTYTSNALEGSTLTESETRVVLEDGLTVSGKPMRDHLAAIDHAEAFDWLWALATEPPTDFLLTEDTLLNLHRLVMSRQIEALPGQHRTTQVFISGDDDLPPPAMALPGLMQTLFQEELPTWQATRHPVEVAALLHWRLVTRHPFTDGNGRTARLAWKTKRGHRGEALTNKTFRVDNLEGPHPARDALPVRGLAPLSPAGRPSASTHPRKPPTRIN